MIYDCFTFFNELDLLRLRLNTLNDVVDYFVLVEADRTFSNVSKRLVYDENKALFREFQDKIIHIVVDDMPEFPKDAWECERFQRNAIMRGLSRCADEDYVIISDLDEIPNPEMVRGFREDGAVFDMDTFYYKLNLKIITEQCRRSVMIRFGNLTTPQEARDSTVGENAYKVLKPGGWHFSYIASPETVAEKIRSFSHQEFNNDTYTSLDGLRDKIESGKDLFDRPDMVLRYVELDRSFPEYLIDHKSEWGEFIRALDSGDRIRNESNRDIIYFSDRVRRISRERDEAVRACREMDDAMCRQKQEIEMMKNSKFWKLRDRYLRLNPLFPRETDAGPESGPECACGK